MTIRFIPVLAALLLGNACNDTKESEPPCADRGGGALITLEIVDETLTLWSTNDDFIAEAETVEDQGVHRIPLFDALHDGSDCDSQWSWHVDPADMAWADSTIELCDGVPSDIENDKAYWLDSLDQFCPWSASVVDVVEQ